MITGHPGLGLDPPKRVGPGKGTHNFIGIEPRFRRFYKNDFEIVCK